MTQEQASQLSRRRLLGHLGHIGAGGAALGALASVVAAACTGAAGTPAAPGQAAGCTTSLDFLIPWAPGATLDVALQQVARDFSQQHPGCPVSVINIPNSADLQPKVTTMLAGGTPPGLTSLPPAWTTTFGAAKLILPVDDLFKRDKLRLEDFPPALQRPMTYDGKLWYMSFNANADFVLHWNKKLFRAVGMDPEKGPTTIAELDDAIPRLTIDEGGELKQIGGEVWNLYGAGNTIQAWGYAFGGSFYDQARDLMTFSQPQIMDAVTWYTNLARRLGDARAKLLEAQAPAGGIHFFVTGKFAIHVLTSTGLFGVRKTDPTMEIGAGPFPGKTRDLAGGVTVGGWGLGAAASAAQREAAWQFMKYVGVDPAGTTSLVTLGGSLPAYLPSPGLDEAAKDPNLKPYVDGIRRAKGVQLGYFAPVTIDLDPIQAVIDGRLGVTEALQTIDQDVNARIKELS
jgi:ABC-type glycerol-3-phosphate transport system substrate-binding protein